MVISTTNAAVIAFRFGTISFLFGEYHPERS
jgi:hypothetical protein